MASLVLSCGGEPQAPLPVSDLRVSPDLFLSGNGTLALTSQTFRDYQLFPLQGPTGFFDRPMRWSNFRVIVGDDTLDSWRTDDTTITAQTPVLLTGEYELRVELSEESAEFPVGVVGQRSDIYWAQLGGYNDTEEAYPLTATRFVVYSPKNADVRLVDPATGDVDQADPRLKYRLGRTPDSRVPGASYRPGHAILNLHDSTEAPRVWRISPSFEPLDTVACYTPGARNIEMAETGPGTCLGIWKDSAQSSSIHANGRNSVTPPDCGLDDAFFVLASGGRFAVPVTRNGFQWGCAGLTNWYIFNSSGSIVASTDRYSQVPAAAFSPGGDTLYLLVDRTPGSANDWAVEVLNPMTGAVLDSLSLDGLELAQSIFPDPSRPYLYVVGKDKNDNRMTMAIIRRDSLRVLGTMYGPRRYGMPVHGVASFGGSAGVLYHLGWCGWDCDLNITAFDLDYELFDSL